MGQDAMILHCAKSAGSMDGEIDLDQVKDKARIGRQQGWVDGVYGLEDSKASRCPLAFATA
jgi:hypothetical protein